MATSALEIKSWFENPSAWPLDSPGKALTHMIVVCDTYDYEDYPVFVHEGTEVWDVIKQYSGNMQKVMEVYSYNLTWDQQTEGRVWNV